MKAKGIGAFSWSGTRRIRKRIGPTVVGGIFASILLLSTLPGAGASTTVAPYHGVAQHTDSFTSTACGRVTLRIPAQFSMATGSGGFRERASGKGCPSKIGSTDVEELTSGMIGAIVPIHLHGTGSHSIAVRWTITAQGGMRGVLGRCQGGSSRSYYCLQLVASDVSEYSYLYDVTTGTTYGSTGGGERAVQLAYSLDCFNGTCSRYNGTFGGSYNSSLYSGTFSGAYQAVSFINATLKATDVYRLVTTVSGSADVEFYASGASFSGSPYGAVWLNLAGARDGATLSSIAVS